MLKLCLAVLALCIAACTTPPPPRKTREATPTTRAPVSTAQSAVAPSAPPPSRAALPQAVLHPTVHRVHPTGLAAPGCVITRRAGESFVKNKCSHGVEARGACMPSYANEDEPYPGTYSVDSWLFTLEAGEEQREPNADSCMKRGGKVLHASCRSGIPYFMSADAARFGCYR